MTIAVIPFIRSKCKSEDESNCSSSSIIDDDDMKRSSDGLESGEFEVSYSNDPHGDLPDESHSRPQPWTPSESQRKPRATNDRRGDSVSHSQWEPFESQRNQRSMCMNANKDICIREDDNDSNNSESSGSVIDDSICGESTEVRQKKTKSSRRWNPFRKMNRKKKIHTKTLRRRSTSSQVKDDNNNSESSGSIIDDDVSPYENSSSGDESSVQLNKNNGDNENERKSRYNFHVKKLIPTKNLKPSPRHPQNGKNIHMEETNSTHSFERRDDVSVDEQNKETYNPSAVSNIQTKISQESCGIQNHNNSYHFQENHNDTNNSVDNPSQATQCRIHLVGENSVWASCSLGCKKNDSPPEKMPMARWNAGEIGVNLPTDLRNIHGIKDCDDDDDNNNAFSEYSLVDKREEEEEIVEISSNCDDATDDYRMYDHHLCDSYSNSTTDGRGHDNLSYIQDGTRKVAPRQRNLLPQHKKQGISRKQQQMILHQPDNKEHSSTPYSKSNIKKMMPNCKTTSPQPRETAPLENDIVDNNNSNAHRDEVLAVRRRRKHYSSKAKQVRDYYERKSRSDRHIDYSWMTDHNEGPSSRDDGGPRMELIQRDLEADITKKKENLTELIGQKIKGQGSRRGR